MVKYFYGFGIIGLKNNINAVQGCLSFINSIDDIDKAVVGVQNLNQQTVNKLFKK